MKYSDSDSLLIWQEKTRTDLVETPVFSLVQSLRRSSFGQERTYYVMEAPDWVNLIALTRDSSGRDCFVMVRQFRHGSNCLSLEFPGGVVDAGETPGQAALRELREETGYQVRQGASRGAMEFLGSVNPNPALMNNRCHTFFAPAVEKVAEPAPESDEHLEVCLVPLEELLAGERAEEFDHAMMHVALGFLLGRLGTPDISRLTNR
ncbi:8-oxo-dGTP pyrophosphatase MutT, NUDIX family [Alkalispirochaeta americana]|uniref:8-oxo-dGTP pyrophosphatase MutT, NUDIX family n=1 Tax=Alkalispirochaeta americana TaxID=159291 RepID=A0A1N6TM86_9SPIO|nr:NUDIX hydrolase [Alkalispirochaeta americana]SIQ54206.1 8-oxo-dGTP pyrophosphatase MutT, NUDIX family [Alkalispirochaeta americana]